MHKVKYAAWHVQPIELIQAVYNWLSHSTGFLDHVRNTEVQCSCPTLWRGLV